MYSSEEYTSYNPSDHQSNMDREDLGGLMQTQTRKFDVFNREIHLSISSRYHTKKRPSDCVFQIHHVAIFFSL